MPPKSSLGQLEGVRLARRTKRTTGAAKAKGTGKDATATIADTAAEDTQPQGGVEDATIVAETPPAEDQAEVTLTSEADGTLGDDSVKASDRPDDMADATVSTELERDPTGADDTLDTTNDTERTDGGLVAADPTNVAESMPGDTMDASSDETQPDGSIDGTVVSDEAKTSETENDPASEPPQQTAMVPPPPQVIEKRSPGFVPLVLGGVIAAAIGYVVATFTQTPPSGGDDRIAALQADIAALQDAPPPSTDATDLAPLETAQAELTDRVAALEAALADRPAAPTGAPATDASTAAVDDGPDLTNVQTELAAVQTELAAVAASVDSLAGDVTGLAGRVDAFDPDAVPALTGRVDGLADRVDGIATTLADLETRAESNADDAEAVARAAARDQLALAVDTGLPYAEPLAQLPDAPEALAANAETGVPTAADLAADFPALARAALREARAAAPGEVGLGSLAGRFLNARSLEPREGDDPDAVLSRAEAAMRAGDVDAALAEIRLLPDEALAPLADWIARAETRAAAQAALNDYLQDG